MVPKMVEGGGKGQRRARSLEREEGGREAHRVQSGGGQQCLTYGEHPHGHGVVVEAIAPQRTPENGRVELVFAVPRKRLAAQEGPQCLQRSRELHVRRRWRVCLGQKAIQLCGR